MAGGYHHQEVLHWQRTRWLGTVLVNINLPKEEPRMTPAELLPLPGDPPIAPPPSLEEIDAELARLAEIDKDWL